MLSNTWLCVFGDVQLRKFVATQSAGLRVRLHPSLQSEQIGVIPPAGVVSFTSEVPTCVCVCVCQLAMLYNRGR